MTTEEIISEIRKSFTPRERTITMHTGVGGMDMFEERMEEYAGLKRVYFRNLKKIARLFRKYFKISHTGHYYKLVPIDPKNVIKIKKAKGRKLKRKPFRYNNKHKKRWYKDVVPAKKVKKAEYR